MGIATGSHVRSATSDRPWPSLPRTRQRPFDPVAAVSAAVASAVGSAQNLRSPSRRVTSSSSSHVKRAIGILKTPPRAALSALSLYGSHVPGSSATASHPSASAVRTSVPRFPGSWIPSSASSLVIRPAPSSAATPATGGMDSSATASTLSTDWSPAAFLMTCSGARTILLAVTPAGTHASSARKSTRALPPPASPPPPQTSERMPEPATTMEPHSSR
mmetsp:Transcript_321/g.1260  ORF Transcript_321/g.1260 Transcript_321/m.1260 type:complete len:218 (-) Transcript_321:311-964(-)